MSKRSVAIVGGGYAGLAAAHELCAAGYEVTIFEAEDDIGGLAGTFELEPGVRTEKFYHHWFTSDVAVLELIEELGLSASLRYVASNTGLYYTNSIFRLASPLDLLGFTPIPFIDRIRTGLMALRARTIKDWRPLENISSEEWLLRLGGKKAYEVIWKPLMTGKFGPETANISAVWIWNKLKLRGSSRNNKGGESLVYFSGGFGALTNALRGALERRGVVFKLRTPIDRVIVEHGQAVGVQHGSTVVRTDKVLVTIPLPQFLNLCPELPAPYVEKCRQVRFLGNVCLILTLDRSLSSTYWLNVADPAFPFVAIIEHTNLDPKENYGNKHVVYLSKYLPTTDPLFSKDANALYDYCEPYIRRIFPAFSPGWVVRKNVWKAHYSQPVVTKHYSQIIPESRTPIQNLWLCTMAQIYPEDRGTNYAVKYGRAIAKELLAT